ncbi:hypothetical protein [Nocardioides sp. JS614]|uniref:hypothetical protein n=1 Tax=Nocardioides sp. (strain ATCC BAA-499 / JS614) TaxID=196162 RepID=UPI0000571242|nr:hypothetical protein [Nocardioides sp. JS614]ABL82551.1 hypothetical protein Noca_3049 [Nocardioides sp. JS614]
MSHPGHRTSLRSGLVQLLIGVVVLAAAGALAGVVWEWVWTAPAGVVADHRWLAEDEAGLRGQFSGTGWFVIVATITGLLAGGLVATFLDRVPLLTLLTVILGSAVGTWVMLSVGSALGPPDPTQLALTAKNGTHLPDELDVSRRTPWVSMPAGALVALTLVFFGFAPGRRHHHDHDHPLDHHHHDHPEHRSDRHSPDHRAG